MDKQSQAMWDELQRMDIPKANKCLHVFPRTKLGEHLKPCTKCNISPALMRPDDTWEWE